MFRGNLNGRSKFFKACKDCVDRHDDCHSDCKTYAEEVILGVILGGEDKKANAMREDEYAVREKRARRIANSCPGAKKTMRKSGFTRNTRG